MLLSLCCWVFVLLGLCCWVCAVGFVLLSLCCWVCAVEFVLLGVCAVGFVLLSLCCWVYSVVSRILSALHSRCCLFHCGFLIYAGFYAMIWFWTFSLLEASLCPISPINSITCFLISLDFGYISCFFLPYVHFSHHGLLVFLRHGLFLGIFASWSFLMSNFSHKSYFMSPDSLFLWTYFSQLPCLYPITCPYLKMIWKKWNDIPPHNPIYNYSVNNL